MNRIETLLTKKQKILCPYITAGDFNPNMTVPLMHALTRGGASILELGIPFSDPMAEGPIIQAAMERALAHGVSSHDVLAMVKEFRLKDADTPVILMGYLNPIEQYGYASFAGDAHASGVDGLIIVDLPPEESHDLHTQCLKNDIYLIYLCSPTTSDERMKTIQKMAHGYLYYVSLKGVTGSNAMDLKALKKEYLHRKAQTSLPMMVGFGIKTPDMAKEISSFADGVVVGAQLINEIEKAHVEKKDVLKASEHFIRAMHDAMEKSS